MKRYFLIFLLLISFNANAIAGSVMMLKMSIATSEMMDDSSMQSMSNHCDSETSKSDNCDEKHNCGLCLFHCNAVVLPEITVAQNHTRFIYESTYHLRDIPNTYSRLLRPPKHV